MSGTTRSSEGLEPRRKKALFRAWHRGTKEMDLLLGPFADAKIGELSDEEMTEFELLMEVPDRDIFQWLTGEAETPDNYDGPVFRAVRRFHLEEKTF